MNRIKPATMEELNLDEDIIEKTLNNFLTFCQDMSDDEYDLRDLTMFNGMQWSIIENFINFMYDEFTDRESMASYDDLKNGGAVDDFIELYASKEEK